MGDNDPEVITTDEYGDIELHTDWVNYGDVNPREHGGGFIRWDPDLHAFRLIVTNPPSTMPEDYCIGRHRVVVRVVGLDDLFVGGDPSNGPTDVLEGIIESLSNVDGFDNAMTDFDLRYFVYDFRYNVRTAHPDWVTDTEEDYWSHLEMYGIDPENV